MLYNTLHRRWPRLIACIVGELLIAVAQNLFIVPLNLYAGGVMGLCQLIRTLLQMYAHLDFGTHDIAGMLYFVLNIPILLFGLKTLGRSLAVKTVICTVAFSLFYSVIPIPTTPIINDYLTSCLLGGLVTGIGCGIILTCGGSSGGLDVFGLALSKRGGAFTVGRLALVFNGVLYSVFLLLFSPEVAIYSVIYNFAVSIVMDRVHQQNVNMQALIFTKLDEQVLARFIIEHLERGVTWWTATGAYTGDNVHVLCVCLSKYEVEELLHVVHSMDEHAFLIVQEGVQVYGTFRRKLE